MNELGPHAFAQEWIAAWNAHDLDSVLAHFHADAVFSSAIARNMGHGDGGKVCGKAAIREYWTAALKANPGLRFELEFVRAGLDVLVIGFRTEDGVPRAEVLEFENGLVKSGFGTSAA